MKKTKKNLILSVCAGALSLLCATGVVAVKANADVTEDNGKVSVSSFTMIKTAATYIGDVNGSDVTGGLRFDATLSKDDYDALAKNYNAVKFGMLVAPTDFIATNVETDLVVGSTSLPEYVAGATYTVADKGMVNQEITPTYNTEDYPNLYAVRCAITNIKEYNFSRPFTARAYIATQKEANGAWEYTYDDSCQRAIYSIATYAINDGLTFSEDASKQRAVESYLNGIIDTVQQYYNITVTQTVNDGTTTEAKIGDTITLNGVATKIDDATKTLDMCPTVTVTENSALTPVANTQGRKYKVTGLGNVAYTWTSGAKSGESQVSGQTKLDILTDEASLSNIKMNKGDSSLAQVQYQGAYSYTLSNYTYAFENVFAWSLKDKTNTENTVANNVAFRPVDSIAKYMKKDMYLYFDLIMKNINVFVSAGGTDCLTYSYASSTADSSNYTYQYYTLDGKKVTSTSQWWPKDQGGFIRLGLKLPNDNFIGNSYSGLAIINGANNLGTKTAYIANMFISTECIEDSNGSIGAINYNKSRTFTGSAFDKASNDSTTTYAKLDNTVSVGGRTGVYAYNWQGSDTGDRLWLDSTTVGAINNGACRYLTFDLYLAEETSLMFCVRGTISGSDKNRNVYFGDSTTGKWLDTDVATITIYQNGRKVEPTFHPADKEHPNGYYAIDEFKTSKGAGKWYSIEVYYKPSVTVTASNWSNYLSCMSALRVENQICIGSVTASNYSLYA